MSGPNKHVSEQQERIRKFAECRRQLTATKRELRRAVKLQQSAQKELDRLWPEVHKLREAAATAFARGSAETMVAIYAAMPSDEIAQWISQRVMAGRVRRPPFNLSPDLEASAVAETQAILAKVGLDTFGPDDIVRMIREDRT